MGIFEYGTEYFAPGEWHFEWQPVDGPGLHERQMGGSVRV
jgi:hypothetical protein